MIDDRNGEKGRSRARNEGVRVCDGDWLFFLDADDLMHPDAFVQVSGYVNDRDAIFGAIWEMKDGVCNWRYQVPEIDNFEDLISFDPYLTLQMGHFVRRDVALSLPFDEEMNCGEDWEYYLRLWKTYKCSKIAHPLMINRRGMHSTGPRSATGAEWSETVHGMIQAART